jgi:hypothetical protein
LIGATFPEHARSRPAGISRERAGLAVDRERIYFSVVAKEGTEWLATVAGGKLRNCRALS